MAAFKRNPEPILASNGSKKQSQAESVKKFIETSAERLKKEVTDGKQTSLNAAMQLTMTSDL